MGIHSIYIANSECNNYNSIWLVLVGVVWTASALDARRGVLAQMSSSFAAEHVWSVYGQVKYQHKLRLKHGRADACVYTHERLQLHEKLLNAAHDEHAFANKTDSDDSNADSLTIVNTEAGRVNVIQKGTTFSLAS